MIPEGAEIKERKLYREKHSSFEAYCQETWGFKRHYAYHLLNAADVCAKMLTMVNILAQTSAALRR